MLARLLPLAALLLAAAALAAQDDTAKTVAEQKKAAAEAWKDLDIGDAATLETRHLIVYAPKVMSARMKTIGALLEKYHASAAKALALKPADAYAGKITVYLLAKPDQMPSFLRRVERRQPMKGQTASFRAEDDQLHAAAAPLEGKLVAPVEARAGEMVAAVLLQRKPGRSTPLPPWLPEGFGRATTYQVYPAKEKFVAAEKALAKKLALRRSWSDVTDGDLEAEEVGPLQGRLGEILAYGAGGARFAKLAESFRPGQNEKSVSTAKALESAGISAERLAKVWKAAK